MKNRGINGHRCVDVVITEWGGGHSRHRCSEGGKIALKRKSSLTGCQWHRQVVSSLPPFTSLLKRFDELTGTQNALPVEDTDKAVSHSLGRGPIF